MARTRYASAYGNGDIRRCTNLDVLSRSTDRPFSFNHRQARKYSLTLLLGATSDRADLPGAGHVDEHDRVELIPFDKLTDLFIENLD